MDFSDAFAWLEISARPRIESNSRLARGFSSSLPTSQTMMPPSEFSFEYATLASIPRPSS
jgi:hypothetical protein